jgi:hypothetical protein
MKLTNIISAAVLAVVATSAVADGPHFTLTVPLALNNLPPEVNSYQVSCSVLQGLTMKGSSQTSGPISGGNFSGNVVVAVTVPPANNPALVDSYICSLHLNGTLAGRSYTFMDDSNTRFPLAAGAILRKFVESPFPR